MSIGKILVSAALVAGLMVVGVNGAFATDTAKPADAPMAQDGSMDSGKAAAHMQKKLGLSDEQTAKMKTIMEDIHTDGEKIRAEMKALHDKMKAEFKSVLTEEQFKKWESMHEDRQQKRMK